MQELIDIPQAILKGETDVVGVGTSFLCIVVLFALSGASMAMRHDRRQILASAIKTPLLPLITTVVCMPALLMMASLLELQLPPGRIVLLILHVQALQGVIVASFAPIILFFSLGSSYDFMKLLIVSIFGLGGIISVARLLDMLATSADGNFHALYLFWGGLYCFVACQTAWMMRPLIGSPSEEFVWLRKRSDLNFYSAVLLSFRRIAGF